MGEMQRRSSCIDWSMRPRGDGRLIKPAPVSARFARFLPLRYSASRGAIKNGEGKKGKNGSCSRRPPLPATARPRATSPRRFFQSDSRNRRRREFRFDARFAVSRSESSVFPLVYARALRRRTGPRKNTQDRLSPRCPPLLQPSPPRSGLLDRHTWGVDYAKPSYSLREMALARSFPSIIGDRRSSAPSSSSSSSRYPRRSSSAEGEGGQRALELARSLDHEAPPSGNISHRERRIIVARSTGFSCEPPQ